MEDDCEIPITKNISFNEGSLWTVIRNEIVGLFF
jgi:hypothetical protein